ncbi:MAG: hypothetical protein LBU95_02475 [Rikenellaceae bacterium]|jgi:hypothetical protein|nr:hypothetical protein [Rikenellaceae bacterium]
MKKLLFVAHLPAASAGCGSNKSKTATATGRNSSLDMLMNNPTKGFVLIGSADGATWIQSRK